jgi:hypothetical protein
MVETRLLPLNAILNLLHPFDVNPSVLHDAGFRLAGLEVPIIGSAGKVNADVILLNSDDPHLVLCEVKSGANIEDDQGHRYSGIDLQAVVDSAHVNLPRRTGIDVEKVYICLAENQPRIELGLTAADLPFPLLVVDHRSVELARVEYASDHLLKAFTGGSHRVDLLAPVTRIVPFDHDSPPEVISSVVEAELISCLSRRMQQISLRGLTERASRHFPLYGRSAQSQMIKRVRDAVIKIAQSVPGTYAIDPPVGNRDGIVRLLRTPEDYDTRGRTPAYQALLKRRQRPRGKDSAYPGQTDLLDELDQVDNETDNDGGVDEEGSP